MSRDKRIPVMFTDAELAEIDEYRFAHRYGTRAAAIRAMCRFALETDKMGREVPTVSENEMFRRLGIGHHTRDRSALGEPQ